MHSIEFDRQWVHPAQTVNRQILQRIIVFQIFAHIGIEIIQRECIARIHRLWVAKEIEIDLTPGLLLYKHCQIKQTGTVVQHTCGVIRPLVAFAEDIGNHLTRRAVEALQKVYLIARRID